MLSKQCLKGSVDFGQQPLGVLFRSASGPQVNLDIARRCQDRRHRIGVLGIHRRDQRVQIGFRESGDPVESCANHLRRKEPRQPRNTLIGEQQL